MADDVELEVAGRTVRISNPNKVYFTKRGETKLDLVRYYLAVGEPLLRAIGGRPIMMERYPDGASGKSFFQKRVPKGAPDWLETVTVATPNGTESEALVAVDLAHVVWAVNLGCLCFHAWATRAADPAHADELRIDLDPQPGVSIEQLRDTAREARALLTELGLTSFAKTTGRRGIHVYVPLEPRYTPYEVRAAAVAFARELERRRGDIATAAWWKEERGARVFVDYNQNAPHKTVFAAWSVRAVVGAQVSTPFRWDELPTIDPAEHTIATVPARVERDGDPWASIGEVACSLDPLLALSERDLAAGMMDAPWPPVYPKMPNEPPRVAPSRARKDPQA
jgi:DNA ligase D